MHAAAKRPMLLLASASVSASAGFMYLGDDGRLRTVAPAPAPAPSDSKRPRRAASKQELGLQQSLARDLACWISSASVYAARQAFVASAAPASASRLRTIAQGDLASHERSQMYHNLFGWLQQISPDAKDWDASQVLESSSFSMLLNVISDAEGRFAMREDVEAELYRAVGVLATNSQCAKAIAERATRYGKQALLNLALLHDEDPRVGDALHRLVALDSTECHFGPANLASLLSLAVADVPDQYLEFALWALAKAASPLALSSGYKWRKALFGDDSAGKTRRKLMASDKLWAALIEVGEQRSDEVKLQAARLIHELSDDSNVARTMRRSGRGTQMLVQWMASTNVPLACTAFDIAAKLVCADRDLQRQLLEAGALDTLRARVLEDTDGQMTANLLAAIRCLSEPTMADGAFVLDRDALSFVNDSDERHLLYEDDVGNMNAVMRHSYIDGWIELYTAFLKSDDEAVRDEAAQCLQQIATHGVHQDQGIQEWLIAVLDSVLDKVPVEIATSSSSVREARTRTLPIRGYGSEPSSYEASHAKALRALAFVLEDKECQEELVRRGGVPLLQILLQSENNLVQRETARVLANLFSCDEMADGLAAFATEDEQLPVVLKLWTQSEDIRLQSLAHRARSNRRYQNARRHGARKGEQVKYLDGVHPLHFSGASSTQQGNYDVDVVLVHGLLGCPYETWTCGEDENSMWAQQWLLEDLKREGCNPRVLSVGYDSQLLASESAWRTMCFEDTSSEILSQLHAARVGCGDRPVVFVTHSLGGVLLKQILLNSSESNEDGDERSLVNNVNGVVFYGVPHHGSPVAQRIQTFKPRQLAQHPVTEHLHGTPHLEMLNDWCAEVFEEKNIPTLSVGETSPCRLPVIGVEALVVPSESANPGFGEFVSISDATHVDVCKPASPDDERYTLAREFISKNATPKESNPVQ